MNENSESQQNPKVETNKKTTSLNVTIDADVKVFIEKEAEEDDRSLSKWLNRLLREYMRSNLNTTHP